MTQLLPRKFIIQRVLGSIPTIIIGLQNKITNTRNYWVFGLRPLSGILKKLAGKRSSFRNAAFLIFLEYRTMDKVRNPGSSERYIPSSEPFKVYLKPIKLSHYNDENFSWRQEYLQLVEYNL
jgi:hypothetical protein